MEIFLISRIIKNSPGRLLFWIGEPFIFSHSKTAVPTHWSKKDLKTQYNEEFFKHYLPRVWVSVAAIVLTLFILTVAITWPSLFITVLLFILLIIGLIDGVRCLARWHYYRTTMAEVEEEEEGGQALVTEGFWRDSSLKALEKQRVKNIKEKEEALKKKYG